MEITYFSNSVINSFILYQKNILLQNGLVMLSLLRTINAFDLLSVTLLTLITIYRIDINKKHTF